jgi:hypothetical protein
VVVAVVGDVPLFPVARAEPSVAPAYSHPFANGPPARG